MRRPRMGLLVLVLASLVLAGYALVRRSRVQPDIGKVIKLEDSCRCGRTP